ncbi:MAG: VWA domain-containing protein [Eubacteriales bacterium]|nr:VWA domain-containing protein [Eubacteriales bacterium]
MKRELTELVFILDKSGSMAGLEKDTIGGFNTMLKKQKNLEGECRITTVLFDHEYCLLHDRIDIRAVHPVTGREYQVGGMTALLDAVGKTIDKIGSAQKHTAEDYRAGKVMVVIITDGMENASRRYSLEKVKSMIKWQKARFDWEFVFLGANIDAVETARDMGIGADRAQNYHADSAGVELNFDAMSEAVSAYRVSSAMPADWQSKIEEDYRSRSAKR